MYKKTLLVVDDEAMVRESIQCLLAREFKVVVAASAKEAVEMSRQTLPDAMIVDLQMPEEDGLAFCKIVRKDQALKNVPILMLSGVGDEQRRTECFVWGADDFIAKPFAGSELVARIRSKLHWQRRPAEETTPDTLTCGNLRINHRRGEVIINDRRIELTGFELKLLTFFLENKDRSLNRDHILAEVWAGNKVTTRTIDTHLCSLRNKLKDFDHEFHTIHGSGYVLRSKILVA